MCSSDLANMKSHEDLRVTRPMEMAARIETLATRHGAVCSFFRPEVLSIPEADLRRWIAEDEGLRLYDFHLSEILRERAHVLSPGEEGLLARTRELSAVPENAFTLLTDADLKFPDIRDEKGSLVELSEERYYRLSRSSDRSVRKAAFEGIHETYGAFRNAIGALYAGSVKGDIFYANARRYRDTLEMSLFGDDVPTCVYDNVVDTAVRFAPLMHHCVTLRQIGRAHV